ncbi:MAG: STAS domain-containing protein [Sedimentisphaerales bacterium]|nr:STAS domain-containing protein [Sedimentisphaerales bacterium]
MDEKNLIEIITRSNAGIVTFQSPSISDVEGIAAVSKQIMAFIEKNRPKRLIFDFEKVKFFSSQVLGLLLEIRAKLEAYNGEVLISAINPQLHRVFRITNLDKIFSFFKDKESAINTINSE